MTHPDDFVRGIARVLQGESLKAKCYVDHKHSLGVLREKIVASLVRAETPERYRVETGFIRDHLGKRENSRQIDLLIHNANVHAPLYRWEDFVVVQAPAAIAVVEVKSRLDEAGFDQIIDLHLSVQAVNRSSVGIPTFAYALTGVSFETFTEYLSATIKANPIGPRYGGGTGEAHRNLPVCIAMQEGNYIAVTPQDKGKEWYCCAVKFVDENSDGMETGTFIDFYSGFMEPTSTSLKSADVSDWFNRQDIPDAFKVYIGEDSVIHHGNIPVSGRE